MRRHNPSRLLFLEFVEPGRRQHVHGDNDKVVPVASAHKLYEAIGSSNKALKILTAEDGGHYHAQADNRQVGTDALADWIAETI